MSTKPAITESHIGSRHHATSGRVIRVAVICALLAGAALLALALLAAVGRGAVASPEAKTILYVCVNKSGQLFYLEPCKKQGQTKTDVTSGATQFKACYQTSSGVTRKVPESTKCSNKTTSKEIEIKVPDGKDPLYFCVGTDGTMYFKGTTEPTCAAPQYAVVIGPLNPVANNDAYSVNEGGTLTKPAPGVLGNDTGSGTLNAVLVSGPAHASSFTLNADGSFNYVHDGGETTSDSFTYKVCDNGSPQKCSVETATVNISINSVNDAPVAVNDNYSVNEGGTLNVAKPGVLGNDTDAEGDGLSAVLVSGPSNASSFTLNPDGSFIYVHSGSETTSDSFTYKANDGSADSNVATVNIIVNPVNDEPSFTAGGDVTVNEDSGAYSATWATAISAGPNESGQNVSFVVTSNSNPSLFSAAPAVSSNGTLTFTTAPNAFGSATVTLFAQDDGGTANGGDDTSPSQTFTITVTAVND